MVKHGSAPFLECSTRGDRRFSAFCACVWGQTIEAHYQGMKLLEDGRIGLGWREAKGHRAVNAQLCTDWYELLWRAYIAQNPHLKGPLCAAAGLSDMFGRPGGVCQATVLWKLRAEFIAELDGRGKRL